MGTTKAEIRRRSIRDDLFGADSWNRAWKSSKEKGFACLPRVLPILLHLAHDRSVTGNLDCGRVYLELFCQDWGQAFIEVNDEEGHAFRAGYTGQRSLRTWRERIETLVEAGFIEVKPNALRKIGYILLRHPQLVIAALREQEKVDDQLWQVYLEVCREFGIDQPEDTLTTPPRVPTSLTAMQRRDDR